MTKVSLTDFRKDMFSIIKDMDKGEKVQLTSNNIVVAEVKKK